MDIRSMHALDRIVVDSLMDFVAYIDGQKWRGRENEAVNLFAFGFLQKKCSPEGPLRDPMQIGVEVGSGDAPKVANPQVRKDLVIWREPGANRWFPYGGTEPLAIVEWKVLRAGIRAAADDNIEWLTTHRGSDATTGYSVLLDLTQEAAGLRLVRVTNEGCAVLMETRTRESAVA
jgi:hypothetical protein